MVGGRLQDTADVRSVQYMTGGSSGQREGQGMAEGRVEGRERLRGDQGRAEGRTGQG
jgi:hypothetical protein